MKKLTFVSGNPKKAEYFSQFIELNAEHRAIDLEEIQSIKMQEIEEQKLREGYKRVNGPVLVEDV